MPDTQIKTETSGLSLRWVVGGIAVLSLLMGVIAHRNLSHSAMVMTKAKKRFAEKGKNLSLHQCARKVLEWNKTECSALQILCSSSIPQITGACLEAIPLREECKTLSLEKSAAHFTFKHCKEKIHVKNREEKKACSKAYGAIRAFCRASSLQRKKGKQ